MDIPTLPLSPARRRFLAVSVACAGLLGLPPAHAAGPRNSSHEPVPVGELKVLDADARAILLAFAEGAIATGNGFPAVRDTGLDARIDQELFFAEPAIRDDFLLALRVADWLPVAYGHFSRLHRMDLPARRAFIDSLGDTRFDTVRALVSGLRLLTGLMYHAHPATWAAMGYDGTHAHLPPRETEQQAYYRSLARGRA